MDTSFETPAIAAAAAPIRKRIGEILIERGKLDAAGLDRALRLQQETHEKLGVLLVTLGLVAQRDVAEALAHQLGLPLVEAAGYPELPILEERVSARFLRDARVLPLAEGEHELVLAMADPTDSYTVSAFEMVTGLKVRPQVAIPTELEAALERLYGAGKSALGQIMGDVEQRDDLAFDADVQHLKDLASEAPVIRLVSLIITNALEMRASDIHIEPFENRLIVRYRIDGVLHEVESPPRRLSPAVISRVKIMANLDIAERRLPQDGRIRLRVQGKDIDLRISTVPTMHGESVVMRILDKGGVALDFKRLGFEEGTLKAFLDVLMEPHGILLVTGPTGSGKTTTLYTALDRLNKPDVKILTVEDPVEYQMPGINQIQVKPQIDLTFANALRSIVRQDPDVIMIGEIRDLETAQIAVQSALTGHLVLSTVHTNDAPSTVNRLLDMGVEDYLLTSTVIGILAQRLVRTLCPHCKEEYVALPELVEEMGLRKFADGGEIRLFHEKGCHECAQTGYIGRISIMEMLPMTDPLRSLVMRHATSTDLRAEAIKGGMTTMYEDGMRKAVAGITTFEEVLRVTRED
ncbi:MAG TPA: type II secretion system ATPase GspE [Casimicrobiaceae bacterium]|nr:type II secretion system ATPase GspE [Casimicrobiaceae bacterium]